MAVRKKKVRVDPNVAASNGGHMLGGQQGSANRGKGQRFERYVASLLREKLGLPEIQRGLQMRTGRDAPDVAGIPGVWLECKHRKTLSVHAALEQASKDMYASSATANSVPVVVARFADAPVPSQKSHRAKLFQVVVLRPGDVTRLSGLYNVQPPGLVSVATSNMRLFDLFGCGAREGSVVSGPRCDVMDFDTGVDWLVRLVKQRMAADGKDVP